MQNQKEHPLHRYYLLLNKHTNKPLWLSLHNKNYMFIVNGKYFSMTKKDFFCLNEKLYILNLSYDVIWRPITIFQMVYKNIFYNVISPFNLKLNISKGKVIPYISKEGVL